MAVSPRTDETPTEGIAGAISAIPLLSALELWPVLVSFTVISACSIGISGEIQQIEPGMNEAQVIEILGEPDDRLEEGEYEALKWSNQMLRVDPPDELGYWVPADYWIVLLGGGVDSRGYGNVEVAEPGRLVLIPIED